ncbi:MAG: hypothetical protein NZ765_01935 [Anaerolineae bacterium]|nr:hypothetical protein [Anaerolineae bacterium]MDW8070738.1 hypothetical protein [Anaerolineae bacterium]
MLPKNVLYYGKEEALPEQRLLRAGPLTVVYEAGDLRYVQYGDQEILRRVYVAVRDRNWGTVLPHLSNIQIEARPDSFRIQYDVENKEGEIDFFWKGSIEGDAQGTITFSMDGIARSTFMRNRIGFCVLHPIKECAGKPCVVERVDGSQEQGTFPFYISPHQPFMDMRAIKHEVVPGLWAKVRFEGDIFEMEDQRNWTDASYKTYCTPLALPFPVEVKAGTRIVQSVTLELEGEAASIPSQPQTDRITFQVGDCGGGDLPAIGLGMASHGRRLTTRELQRLRMLQLSHLRADLWFSQGNWEAELARAISEANALGVGLELALILSDAAEKELKAFAGALGAATRSMRPRIDRWLIFHEREKSTSAQWITVARQHLASWTPSARFVSGTNHFFAELNRGRPPVALLDGITYSINPQVHAFDNASLVENLAAQASTVESARQFSAGLPIIVSPVTLRMRLNPNATAPEPEPLPGELPSQVDVRQMSLFGAGWTLGSLKYLAESGVHSVTFYETTGWLGVMEREEGSPLPTVFRSLPGAVFPMYHVFADIAEFAGGQVIPSVSSATLRVDGLTVRKGERKRVMLANLTNQEQVIDVVGLGGRVYVRLLDETNAEHAMQSPEAFREQKGELITPRNGSLELALLPYAIATIDSA